MLIYLITSLPKLYIGKTPKITKSKFIKHVYLHIPQNMLFDFNMLIDMDKQKKVYDKQITLELKNKYISYARILLLNILKKTKNIFLKNWISFSIKLQEIITGLLCKKNQLKKNEARRHFENHFDPISKYILNHYNSIDLSLSKRFLWFSKLFKIIKNNDLEKIEITIDSIKLHMINYLKHHSIFHVDTLLTYYLELSILERQANFDNSQGNIKIQKILDSINI